MIIILLYISYNRYYIESFDDAKDAIDSVNSGIGFEMGTSGITPTGTITFNRPFVKIPIIFTQIIGASDTSNSSFSIQIFDITTKNFNYSKNKLYGELVTNENIEDATILKLDNSTVEKFTWIAIG
jgi:hypothetical protein